jgi:CHAD domain-containing protein
MSTKWAEDGHPDVPAREFARTILTERVNSVEELLPHAAYHFQDDVEHVHQLRVACRRSSAALRAFAPLMNEKPRKLKEWLSRIRDAAGPARDKDVLLARFSEEEADEVTEYAIARLRDERKQAQKLLVKVAKKATSGKLDRVLEQTLELLGKPSKKPNLAKYGHGAVHLAYAPFARLMRLDNPTTDELHQLRIAGKRLRYSLEIFHGLFPDELHNDIYPQIEELQSRLGDINDHATAQSLYQSWLAKMEPDDLAGAVAGRVISERKALLRLQSQFLRWWTPRRIARLETFFAACQVDHK